MPRILLIDDDQKLARLLADYLRAQGLEVHTAHDGMEGLNRAQTEHWDLLVMDVMMPRLDGITVLKRLRETQAVPVLMLTARGAETERIAGLELGADDYLPKTVSARELLARIRAQLRRAAMGPVAPASTELGIGSLKLHVAQRLATDHGQPLPLTPVEFDLLLALARHAGAVCSREQLLAEVRDRSFDAGDRSVDVHIAALRRKLGDYPKAPQRIRTVRAAGYLLVAAP